MKKSDEVTNPNSCFNKAKDDELLFVLRGHDLAAPLAIREWVRARILFKKNREGDEQLKDAMQIAAEMEKSQPYVAILGSTPLNESNLERHARTELERAGLFSKDSDYEGMLGHAVMRMAQQFAAEGHSGFSAARTLAIFDRVAQFKTLTPITSDPSEWMDVGDGQWQNRRQSSCFSKDGGKTYYDIDARDGDRTPRTPEEHAARPRRKEWVNSDVLGMANDILQQAAQVRDEEAFAEERRGLMYRAAGFLLSAMTQLEHLSKLAKR